MTDTTALLGLADQLAAALAAPLGTELALLNQSLAKGAPGIALLHVERTHTGGDWAPVYAWLHLATTGQIDASPTARLFAGAPSLAFALAGAAGDQPRWPDAQAHLASAVQALTHHRVDAALDRIRAGHLAEFAEYDLLYGLTGIGAHLLRHDPGGDGLGRILDYLTQLTQPIQVAGEQLPGWWVGHDPHNQHAPTGAFAVGHGNLGIAHGITGPLALLALAHRAGITVDGHVEAMQRICSWLDQWQQDGPTGVWWPQWTSQGDHQTGQPGQTRPGRPSWCYGTPGIARAQQLAALALADTVRQDMAEQALLDTLTEPDQLTLVTDPGLCHGWAGIYQTVWRATADARKPALSSLLPDLAHRLVRYARTRTGPGLLEGDAGLALALRTAASNRAPATGWDACLLLT